MPGQIRQSRISGLLEDNALGDPLVVSETKKALKSMANGKAMGPDELPGNCSSLGFPILPTKSCSHSTASSWLYG